MNNNIGYNILLSLTTIGGIYGVNDKVIAMVPWWVYVAYIFIIGVAAIIAGIFGAVIQDYLKTKYRLFKDKTKRKWIGSGRLHSGG